MLKSRIRSRLDAKKNQLHASQPFPVAAIRRLHDELLIEWIYHSNAIGGNTFSIRETRILLESGLTVGGKSLREHREVLNHRAAIDYVESLVADDVELTSFHVQKMHRLLLAQIDGLYAGQYRVSTIRIAGGEHRPPDPWEIRSRMQAWDEWLQGNSSTLHPVERAAIAHHRLVAIQPYIDANGRTARLVMNALLMQHGYPPAVISITNHRQYARVLAQADAGNPAPLANFIGRAVEHSLMLYLDACTPRTAPPPYEDRWISLRAATEGTSYSQEYLSLLARTGKLEAVKQGRNWVTTRKAVRAYQLSLA